MKRGLKITFAIILLLAVSATLFACADREIISAYDIAVKNGFVGTEEEWLASLHGLNGLNGLDGEDGADGKNLISIEDVYNAAVDNGFEGSFLEFIDRYMDADFVYDDTYAVAKSIRSAVIIRSNFKKTVSQFDWRTGQWVNKSEEYSAGGAGVIYKMDSAGNAYIITNFHVVYDNSSNQENKISDDIELYLYGGLNEKGKIEARFIGGSAYHDIAVLKVSGSEVLKNSDAVAVEVAKGTVAVGQTAMAIGYPAGEGMSVTRGIVSVDSEQIAVAVDSVNNYPLRVMRVDTAINSGNSGGGLFDSTGKLIGIVNAKYSSTQIENIGYAIPKEVAVGVADNIIKNCANSSKIGVYKCLIGVTATAKESRAVYDESSCKTVIKEVIEVSSVNEGSAAEGVLQVGDILKKATLHGVTVTLDRTFVLSDFLLSASVGDTVTIVYERDGEEKTAQITFAEKDVEVYFVA